MVAFVLGVLCSPGSLPDEASCLTKHFFLDIELVAAEVSRYLECLSVVSEAGTS